MWKRLVGDGASGRWSSWPRAIRLGVVLLALPAATRAQARPAADSTQPGSASVPRASVPRASVRDTLCHRPPDAPFQLLVIAPSALLSLPTCGTSPDTVPLGFWRNHVAAYVGGGVTMGDSVGGDMLSANLELLAHGLFAELRWERLEELRHYQYRTAKVGWLTHPQGSLAGGVTVGYRATRDLERHDEGVELGFPLITGRRRWWLRFDVDYVVSTHQTSWNYRMQWERLLGAGPFLVGIDAEAKTLPIRNHGTLSAVPLTVIVGIRP